MDARLRWAGVHNNYRSSVECWSMAEQKPSADYSADVTMFDVNRTSVHLYDIVDGTLSLQIFKNNLCFD